VVSEHTTTRLAAGLGISTSSASTHAAALRDAGLVETRRDGRGGAPHPHRTRQATGVCPAVERRTQEVVAAFAGSRPPSAPCRVRDRRCARAAPRPPRRRPSRPGSVALSHRTRS
jgi:hypothetical protein